MHDEGAAVGDLDDGRLRPLHAGGDLDVGGEADAEGDRVACRPAAGLFGAQLVVAGGVEGAVERLGIVADVVTRADAGRVRRGEAGHVVAPAHLGRIDADLGGEAVDHPLDGDRRLGPAGAAVGGGRHGLVTTETPVKPTLSRS